MKDIDSLTFTSQDYEAALLNIPEFKAACQGPNFSDRKEKKKTNKWTRVLLIRSRAKLIILKWYWRPESKCEWPVWGGERGGLRNGIGMQVVTGPNDLQPHALWCIDCTFY